MIKHGLDFRDVPYVFEQETYTDIDDRYDYRELRYFTLGIFRGIIVAISHTEANDFIRVISFRKAEKHEQELYFTSIRD